MGVDTCDDEILMFMLIGGRQDKFQRALVAVAVHMALIVVLTEHRPMAVDNILIVENQRNVQDVSLCSDRIPHNTLCCF